MDAFVFSQARSRQAGTDDPSGPVPGSSPFGQQLRRPRRRSRMSKNPPGTEPGTGQEILGSVPIRRSPSQARMRTVPSQLFFAVPAARRDGTHGGTAGGTLTSRNPGRGPGNRRGAPPGKPFPAAGTGGIGASR